MPWHSGQQSSSSSIGGSSSIGNNGFKLYMSFGCAIFYLYKFEVFELDFQLRSHSRMVRDGVPARRRRSLLN
ncbi:MAG: hypothetical protein V7K96_32505 [Nostoc sp.]